MIFKTYTVVFEGVEARCIEVQCALSAGLPGFSIVGLPNKAVSEARDRVRSALASMSIALPSKRITVNLSPADLPKDGSHFDLPIALALMAAIGVAKENKVTTIIISHKNSILSAVDKIMVLKDGMIASFGSKDEVMEKLQKAQNMSLGN